ncbi:DUF416 family protein [Mucilaginibacter litoreus]|uniref:DUF416 family protein n=1 Tax=Mucilaginibacter litoreus TaxID=1048221 RepID=A0ABW3ANE5_9SPHI
MQIELDTLKNLAFEKQLTFCYLICERLLPNYETFYEQHNWGNPTLLKHVVAFIRDQIGLKSVDHENAKKLLAVVEDIAPHTEDFPDLWGSAALDTCVAIAESLEFIENESPDRVIAVSTLATDTVDMFVQDVIDLNYNYHNREEFELAISNHPLMQKELNLQKQIISYLTQASAITNVEIYHLLSLQQNNDSAK